MTAFVVPLAMTTKIEVISKKVVMTLIPGVIPVSIFIVLVSTRLDVRAVSRHWTSPPADEYKIINDCQVAFLVVSWDRGNTCGDKMRGL